MHLYLRDNFFVSQLKNLYLLAFLNDTIYINIKRYMDVGCVNILIIDIKKQHGIANNKQNKFVSSDCIL